MYFEKLALEVNANAAGLEVVKPAELRGKSGIDQRFAFVAKDRETVYAFDICAEVTEKEVLKTYVKKLDTGANSFVVCLKGRPTVEASELACYYGISIITPGMVGDLFSKRIEVSLQPAERLRVLT